MAWSVFSTMRSSVPYGTSCGEGLVMASVDFQHIYVTDVDSQHVAVSRLTRTGSVRPPVRRTLGVVSCTLQRRCAMQRRAPRLALLTFVVCLMATAASAQVVRQEVEGIRNFAKVESTVACAGAVSPGAI